MPSMEFLVQCDRKIRSRVVTADTGREIMATKGLMKAGEGRGNG